MNQLLKDLKKDIEKYSQNNSLTIDELIPLLQQEKKYQKTSSETLKINIKKIFKNQNNEKEKLKIGENNNTQNGFKNTIEKIEFFDKTPNINLHDLGGLKTIKKDIKQFIDINIKNKKLYLQLGFKRGRKNILIKGPQGCGKTTLAQCIAKEIGFPQIKVNMFDSRIFSSVSDNKLSNFLLMVVKNSPCTLIIDDLDHFFEKESSGIKQAVRKTIKQLLDFFDLTFDLDIIVIGVTNKIEVISSDFLQIGRFEKTIEIKLPDEKERILIIKKLLQNKKIDKNLNFQEISNLTAGFVGSDLKNLIYKTGENTIQRYLNNNNEKLIIKQSDFQKSIPQINPIIKKEGFTTVPLTSFNDIGALQDLKKELEELILNPLKNHAKCKQFNLSSKAGILLYGPPGCGKTMLAKAVANACKANFIYVKGPELLSKYFGESEKSVRGLFERARLSAPCLIFFDEIDGLCPKRSSDGNQVIERVVNQLLTELNGVEEMRGIFVIGATNRPDIIDKAVLRPERLGVHLYVPLPNKQDRIDILKTQVQNRPIDSNVCVEQFNELFDLSNYTGADLNAFVETAARVAAWSVDNHSTIQLQDFQQAFPKCKASLNKTDLIYYDNLYKNFK